MSISGVLSFSSYWGSVSGGLLICFRVRCRVSSVWVRWLAVVQRALFTILLRILFCIAVPVYFSLKYLLRFGDIPLLVLLWEKGIWICILKPCMFANVFNMFSHWNHGLIEHRIQGWKLFFLRNLKVMLRFQLWENLLNYFIDYFPLYFVNSCFLELLLFRY